MASAQQLLRLKWKDLTQLNCFFWEFPLLTNQSPGQHSSPQGPSGYPGELCFPPQS